MTLEASSRWSLVARCPRAGALALLGAEPSPVDDHVRRLWRRGKDCGRYVVEQLREKYGAEQVIPEKPVHWPLGIGHADAYVIPERLLAEVKSRVGLDATDDDILQLGGYLHFDEEAERGALILIDPRDYEQRILPIVLTDRLRDAVEERVTAVAAVAHGGALPECVAEIPAQCRFGKFCPFTDQAWQGWEPPATVFLGDGEIASLAAGLYVAERAWKSAQGEEQALKEEWDEARARLRDVLEPGVLYEAGGVQIRRTLVRPRVTYDIPTALSAGIVTEELLAPFRRVGAESERWRMERIGELAAVDYGEVPW